MKLRMAVALFPVLSLLVAGPLKGVEAVEQKSEATIQALPLTAMVGTILPNYAQKGRFQCSTDPKATWDSGDHKLVQSWEGSAASTFLRPLVIPKNSPAFITGTLWVASPDKDIPEMEHGTQLEGTMTLTFSTATAGTITFERPPNGDIAVGKITFSQYSATYDLKTLKARVKFMVNMGMCQVLFDAIYRGSNI